VLVPAVALLVGACGPRKKEVELTFYDDTAGPHGFTCRENGNPDKLLVERVVRDGRLTLVVDFFQLDATPTCSGIALLEWCHVNPCPLLTGKRSCVDVPLAFLEDAGNASPQTLVRRALAEVKGELVTASAPDAIVLVRVVATTASCADVAKEGVAFECSKLVGCANSCPVYLPEAGADVQLDLDANPGQCDETTIRVCSAPDLAHFQDNCGK
jgi:hypothetical protein